MKENIETGIRLKVILIYMVVAAVCLGMIMYLYNQRQNINHQKQHIEQYRHSLALTNEYVSLVNKAQADANQYVASKKAVYLKSFKQKNAEVELLGDSLGMNAGLTSRDSIIGEIGVLLREKGNTIFILNRLFEVQYPLEPIYEEIRLPNITLQPQSLLVTTKMKDTVIRTVPKKRLWGRVADIFSPNVIVDTFVRTTTQKIDTLALVPDQTTKFLPAKSSITKLANASYSRQLTAIEGQVNRLILTDQEISMQISTLLHQLSNQAINSTLEETQRSERIIQQNYNFSIIAGGISMMLILVFILLIIHDINKGKIMRKALEQANARTRQIMESRHQLLLSVSHDIKTPLGSILGYLELSQTENTLPQERLISMQNSGKHILSLLENLLEFSSLEQGTLVAANCHFNLWTLCKETAGIFDPLALQKKLSFNCDIAVDPHAEVYSDPLRIKQILINILSNSVKYTPTGTVSFQAVYDGSVICFNINDTGVGIPADQMDALFKPFTRVDKNNALAPGSGLGMFVVKGLVDLLHGTIRVSSTEGEGTRIEVIIPVKTVPEKHTLKITSKNILLIDDDPALLAMLRDMLLKLGFKIDICNNPAEFEPQKEDLGKYGMVITDMEMGAISGIDILKNIRSTGTKIPVAIMTGWSDYSELKAIEAGFDAYLPKPITMSSLSRLTGGKDQPAGEFASLEEMFEGDQQAITGVLEVFIRSTDENIRMLREAIALNDFGKAQALCHKMLPMFLQLGAHEDCVGFLRQMDAARVEGADKVPFWRGKASDFTVKAEKLMKKIYKEYLENTG